MKILIVDDNPENIDMMMIMLRSNNYSVTPASNGQEALEKLNSGEFDLIISDILMPVMDGFQFCRECKKDAQLSKISFIFYTATYIDEKDEEFALALGARKFMRKPQEPEVFLNLVKEVIEGNGNEKNSPNLSTKPEEKEILKLYNERLIAKLEKKNLDLENEIASHIIAEQALVESEEKFNKAFQNSPDAIAITKVADGTIIEVNESFQRISGYSKSNIIGRSSIIMDLWVSPQDRDKYIELLKEKGSITDFETRFRTKTGEIRYFMISGELFNLRGEPVILGIIRDITERKEADTALRESEERFRFVFEFSSIGKSLTSPDGKLMRINNTFADMLGYSIEDMQQLNFVDITHPDDIPDSRECMRILLANEQDKYRMEKRYFHKNGKIIWADVSTSLLRNGSGIAKYFITNIIDITDKKDQELELIKAKEKAEESDKLKTAFLQNISHEIRTPLNGILGFSDLVTSIDITTDTRGQYAKIIRESGNQLLSIVDDIICIATIEAGQEKSQEKETNINKLLEFIKTQNIQKAELKKLSFSISSELTNEEAFVMIDETKLIQILTNLLNNAIKFTSVGHIKVTCRLENNFILFTINDSGIGIPSEMHERIFDRFFQIDSDNSQLHGGTGLGLSIVKSYVQLLKGEIHLDSKPGEGTVFYITLPYVPVKEVVKSSDKALKQKNKELSGKVILVAEDDDYSYAYLEEILFQNKIKAIRAINGREAVEFCKTNTEIELVFMDIRMPELSGLEATRQILQFRKDLPIIAQTAYTFFNDRQKAMEAGCTSYIEKPLNPQRIMDSIRKYL
jgi:PAS domain S-box-containing protein